MERKTRLQIRKTIYRGNPGFLVMRVGQGMFGERIFTPYKDVAEHIRGKLNAGQQLVLDDYKQKGA
jgi:hypothetical protein